MCAVWYSRSSSFILRSFFFLSCKWHTQIAHFLSILYVPSAYFVEHTRLVLHIKRNLSDILFFMIFFLSLSLSLALATTSMIYMSSYLYVSRLLNDDDDEHERRRKKTNTDMSNRPFTKSLPHKYWLRFFSLPTDTRDVMMIIIIIS